MRDRSLPVTGAAFTDLDQLLQKLNDLWSWIEVTKSQGAFLRNNRPNGPRTKIRVPKRLFDALLEGGFIEHSQGEIYHPPSRKLYILRGTETKSSIAMRFRILQGLRRSKNNNGKDSGK